LSRTLPYADMEKILSISKRRGFVFQSSEIYGGLGSTWDYGPLGVELKRHVKEAWWRSVVLDRDDMVGLDAAILMHPQVWVASGHVENFTDPLVECRSCNRRFRLDHLAEAAGIEFDPDQTAKLLENLACPECSGALGDPRQFNLSRPSWVRWRTPPAKCICVPRLRKGCSSISPMCSIPHGRSFP